jgi:hypothetical protein
MTTLFISYARKDKAKVYSLADELRDLGFEVWVDVSGIKGGKQWSAEIVKAITDCDFFLLFISSASIESDNVRREVDLAYHNKKHIIPLRLEKVDIPLAWAYQTVGIQWIECSETGWKSRLLVALGSQNKIPDVAIEDAGKPFKKMQSRVQIIIEGEIEDFNETRREDLVLMLAAVLRLDADEIRLLSVNQGSVVVDLIISETGANRLFDLARKKDFRLVELGISSVFFDLDDVASQEQDILSEVDPFISVNQARRLIEIKLWSNQEDNKSSDGRLITRLLDKFLRRDSRKRRQDPRSGQMVPEGYAGSEVLTKSSSTIGVGIAALAIVVAAMIGYLGLVRPASLAVEATGTAEAFGTLAALTTQEYEMSLTRAASPSPVPTITVSATPSPGGLTQIVIVDVQPSSGSEAPPDSSACLWTEASGPGASIVLTLEQESIVHMLRVSLFTPFVQRVRLVFSDNSEQTVTFERVGDYVYQEIPLDPVRTTTITVQVLEVENNSFESYGICHIEVFGIVH